MSKIDTLRTCLVDTFITDLPSAFRNMKNHGEESTDLPVIFGLNRAERIQAETLLTELGIRGYWSRASKALVLPVPLKQRGQPRTEAALFISQALKSAGFQSSIISE